MYKPTGAYQQYTCTNTQALTNNTHVQTDRRLPTIHMYKQTGAYQQYTCTNRQALTNNTHVQTHRRLPGWENQTKPPFCVKHSVSESILDRQSLSILCCMLCTRPCSYSYHKRTWLCIWLRLRRFTTQIETLYDSDSDSV